MVESAPELQQLLKIFTKNIAETNSTKKLFQKFTTKNPKTLLKTFMF